MEHRGVVRALTLSLFCVALTTTAARGDVDLTPGAWQVVVQSQPPHSPVENGIWTFRHTIFGITTLEATSPSGRFYRGNFSPASGSFSVIAEPPDCIGPVAVVPRLDGTVDATSVAFEATLRVTNPLSLPMDRCIFLLEMQATGQRICGNGALDPGEQCDDGNAANGDCCSANCEIAPPGSACGACSACNAAGACVLAPLPAATCKQPVESGAARLTVKNHPVDTKDTLQWKWNKGEEITVAEFGQPNASDDYRLCVFDVSSATPAFVLSARAPAGPEWQPKSSGFSYQNRTLAPEGLKSVTLKAGTAGKAKIAVKGKGDLLPLPASSSPLSLPLLVQLQGDHGGCWEARFETATKNDGITFKARSE